MKAIIYAAGRGQRLGAEGADRPKVLLSFGGRSLLEWHLIRLRQAGVGELVLVTGYQRQHLLEHLETIKDAVPLSIREYFNPDFTEGSVLSFHAALAELDASVDPVLLMDADVLYPGLFLEKLIRSSARTALLLDRNYNANDQDPVLVPVKNGRPIDFKKQWQGNASLVGESVGFFKIAPADLPLLREETSKRISGCRRQDSYDEVLRALVLAGRFGYEDITGLPWTEIDFPEDAERARTEVLPAIQRLEQNPSA